MQETLLRAWRSRHRLEPDGNFRAWCYRIATNVCLDLLRRRSRRRERAVVDVRRGAVAAALPGPAARRARRARRRARRGRRRSGDDRARVPGRAPAAPAAPAGRLVARDLLGWTADETAELLETSVAAANSALQRARATMQARLPHERARVVDGRAQRRGPGAARAVHRRARALRRRGRDRHRRTRPARHHAAVPVPVRGPRRGRACSCDAASRTERDGDWRLLPTRANRMPAAGATSAGPATPSSGRSSSTCCASRDGAVAEITTFGPSRFPELGLPDTL